VRGRIEGVDVRGVGLAVIAWIALAGCTHVATNSHRTTRLAIARVYMGVACPRPNSIRCDRVGLAVWLPDRVRRLDASISGMPVTLRWRAETDAAEWGITRYRRISYYEGYLAPARLIEGPLHVRPDRGRYYWTGRHPTSARVRLVARYGSGKVARVRMRVGLAAGWG
jgi:hypothetical protein